MGIKPYENYRKYYYFQRVYQKPTHLANVRPIPRYQFWCTGFSYQLINFLQWCSSRYSPVAKPHIFRHSCNWIRTKFVCLFVCFLLFPYLWGVLFKNLNDATLILGQSAQFANQGGHNQKSCSCQYCSNCAMYQYNFSVYPHVLRIKGSKD